VYFVVVLINPYSRKKGSVLRRGWGHFGVRGYG